MAADASLAAGIMAWMQVKKFSFENLTAFHYTVQENCPVRKILNNFTQVITVSHFLKKYIQAAFKDYHYISGRQS